MSRATDCQLPIVHPSCCFLINRAVMLREQQCAHLRTNFSFQAYLEPDPILASEMQVQLLGKVSEKFLQRIRHLFMMKNSLQTRTRREPLNLIKGIYRTPSESTILSWCNIKHLLCMTESQVNTLLLPFGMTLSWWSQPLQKGKRKKEKAQKFKRRKYFAFADVENPKNP